MTKSSNKTQIVIDTATDFVYNTSMTNSNNNSNKGIKNMISELEAKVIELQNEQRKAEDAGNMAKADELQKKIEYFYSRNS
tara:strand:+ start:142 stop:384 length:243 start_codon:yes stop_codon:yes gene_type:complete